MENILHDFNENVISLMVEFLKNSIMEGGLSNFTDDLNDKLMKLGFDLTKFALEYAEDVIFNLKERKTEYESLEKDDRKIITIFGEIDFKRRYYLDKEKNKRVYLLDEYFKIAPKERLLENVEIRLIEEAIETNYEKGGEYKAIKKLNTLQSYLSNDLERYQDVLEVPEAPKGIEYRNMGTQESQIFSKLKKRFCSGRKAFSIRGANALSKICVLSEKFKIEEIEEPIPIDTSVEDWIKEIEEKIKETKEYHCAKEKKKTSIETGIKEGHSELKFMKEIEKVMSFSEMRCSF